MIRKLKKGFTLVELVVVIAVIAILAAVSVVSYLGITKKAQESNDHSLIDQVNLSVAAASTQGRKATLHEVLEDLKEDSGFGVEKLSPDLEGAQFVYSYSMNKFAYWKNNDVVYPQDVVDNSSARGLDLWFFTDADSTGNLSDGHSHYLRSSQSKTIKTDAGLDVGSQAINEVKYEHSGARQEVVIRTDGGSLIVDAVNDHVKHYGIANLTNIKAVAPTSYVEYGNVSMAKIKNGRIIVSETAVLPTIHVVETGGNYDGIKIALMGNATLPELSRDEVSMSNGDKKLVVEVQSVATEVAVDPSPEYVWISKSGDDVSTEVASSGSTLDSSTIIPASSQSAAAKKAAEDAEEGLTPTEVEEMEEIASRYAGGKGTEKSPYLLATKHHFGSIDEDIHDGLTAGKYFKIITDMDLGEMSPLGWMTLSGKADAQGYTITGDESFNGNLDGDDHTLKFTMNIDTSYTASTVGLFGSIQDCVISDITLDVDINCAKGTTWVGGIAGFGMSSDLKNVTVKGSIYGKHDVGGFFGYFGNDSNNGSNTFENCVNEAAVVNECDRSPNYSPTGGFIGQLAFNNVDYTLTFKNCVNNAAVSTTSGGYSATSHFVGFMSDNAASNGYNVRVNFNNCSTGSDASVSSTIATIRTVSNKSVYCCTTEASIAACPATKYIGITSKLTAAAASPTKVYINGVTQNMSLYIL